jgi:hypothetical protein
VVLVVLVVVVQVQQVLAQQVLLALALRVEAAVGEVAVQVVVKAAQASLLSKSPTLLKRHSQVVWHPLCLLLSLGSISTRWLRHLQRMRLWHLTQFFLPTSLWLQEVVLGVVLGVAVEQVVTALTLLVALVAVLLLSLPLLQH